jgi:hypothetical protein
MGQWWFFLIETIGSRTNGHILSAHTICLFGIQSFSIHLMLFFLLFIRQLNVFLCCFTFICLNRHLHLLFAAHLCSYACYMIVLSTCWQLLAAWVSLCSCVVSFRCLILLNKLTILLITWRPVYNIWLKILQANPHLYQQYTFTCTEFCICFLN